jgi:glycosyltransferase involved in cell wall biosynthesis
MNTEQEQVSNPTRICFVSIEAYATLKPGVSNIAGGAGFQVLQIGHRLSELDHEVSYIVGDFGQPFRDVVDGCTTYRASSISGGKNPLRGLANVVRIFRAMRAARAKHYVLRANRNLVFFVFVFSRLLGARFSFMVADHRHVTRQGIESMNGVIRFLYNVPPLSETAPGKIHDLIWVGSIKPIKRPDRLLEIARCLPERSFLVAGGPGSQRARDRAYYNTMISGFSSQPNLTYRGFVPPDRVGEIYRSGRLLLLTSDYEGFPNAFLHAWANAVPVCSVDVDPDGVIEARGLGIVDSDLNSLAGKIDSLLNNYAAYEAMRLRCYEHARENHSLERMEAAFIDALPEL